MHSSGGDVTLSQGTLLVKRFDGRLHEGWVVEMQDASLKIYHNIKKPVYELHVDSNEAISADQGLPHNAKLQHIKFELTAPMNFTIATIQDLGMELPQSIYTVGSFVCI